MGAIEVSQEMDLPPFSSASISHNGCDLGGNYPPRGGESYGTAAASSCALGWRIWVNTCGSFAVNLKPGLPATCEAQSRVVFTVGLRKKVLLISMVSTYLVRYVRGSKPRGGVAG